MYSARCPARPGPAGRSGHQAGHLRGGTGLTAVCGRPSSVSFLRPTDCTLRWRPEQERARRPLPIARRCNELAQRATFARNDQALLINDRASAGPATRLKVAVHLQPPRLPDAAGLCGLEVGRPDQPLGFVAGPVVADRVEEDRGQARPCRKWLLGNLSVGGLATVHAKGAAGDPGFQAGSSPDALNGQYDQSPSGSVV